jgi:hypothetical protein
MLPRKDFYVNKILEIQMPFLGIARLSPTCRPLIARLSPTYRPFTTCPSPTCCRLVACSLHNEHPIVVH